MLALKKKREAEAKRAEEEQQASTEGNEKGTEKVSLLGIGGKKTKNGELGKTGAKKRTPGEIRIQKGTFSYSFDSTSRRKCIGFEEAA